MPVKLDIYIAGVPIQNGNWNWDVKKIYRYCEYS